jgi:hypothetical protein
MPQQKARPIDWDRIRIVIEPKSDFSPQGAAEDDQEPSEALVALVRRILLRRVRRIAQN